VKIFIKLPFIRNVERTRVAKLLNVGSRILILKSQGDKNSGETRAMGDSAKADQKTAEPRHIRWRRRVAWWAMALLVAPLMGSAALVAVRGTDHWSTASRAATGQAPDPAFTDEAVVQAYAARTWGWRGVFAVHSWIVVKAPGADQYTRLEVIGWRQYYGRPVLKISHATPDGRWFSVKPQLLTDVRGPKAAALIPQIYKAVQRYPYQQEYTTWPGPNSNTFTAWVGRHVPDLGLRLPVTAVGKDYLAEGKLVSVPPGGQGVQLSLGGLLGVLAGREEGIEVNILGAAFGIDPHPLAIKLPGIGRIGWR
jgi:hypothetical protein